MGHHRDHKESWEPPDQQLLLQISVSNPPSGTKMDFQYVGYFLFKFGTKDCSFEPQVRVQLEKRVNVSGKK